MSLKRADIEVMYDKVHFECGQLTLWRDGQIVLCVPDVVYSGVSYSSVVGDI